MSKRQASILAAFSRQQEAQAKRRKASDAALPDDEATVRRRRVGAERAAVERGQSADASDGETGSVTDGDLLSSQEDVQDAGWGGSGGSGGDRGERGATDASAAFVDERRSGAAVVGAGEREAPAVVEDVVDKVGGMELNVAAKMSLSIARAKLHTQKEIKDSVHGLISFEPICMRIIDTLQFQRLRNLHQLGAAHYVYIGATHSRFEHCLGVAYLAEQMVQNIRMVQPWLPITKTDVLCIKIAGLCHDLGHGPFSHVFDGIFVDQLRRQRILKESFRWTHERGSLDMLDHLLVSNCIDVADYGLSELDLVFIKELIYGGPLPGNSNLCGRPANDQRFLYDFVNNSKSGLDVDKLDYFMRDSLHTGAKMSCDTALLIRGARVLADEEDGGRTMAICFPEKLAGQVMQAFHTRYELHHSVYQHKGVRAIEYMVCDVLVAAHEHLRIKNKLVSEVFYCMDAYQHLDDRVLARIQDSEGPELEAARAILNRIFTKPYYEYVGQTPVTTHSRAKSEDMLLNEILYCSSRRSLVQSKDQIILEFMRIHYGKGAEDPLNHVRFYSKSAVASSSCYRLPPEAYEMFCPKQFEERSIRVFVKDPSLSFVVREALEIWTRKFNRSVLLPIGSSR